MAPYGTELLVPLAQPTQIPPGMTGQRSDEVAAVYGDRARPQLAENREGLPGGAGVVVVVVA